jgi:hypothetical protein
MTALAAVVNPSASNFRVKLGGIALARGRDLEKTGKLYRARPWLIFANVLSFYDLARATAKNRLRAFLQVFSLAVGLVASLVLSRITGPTAWIAFLIGVIFSTTDLALEIKGLRREDVTCVITDLSGDADRAKQLPKTIASPKNVISFKSSYALYNREVNDELSRQSAALPGAPNLTHVTWSNKPSPLPVRVQEWRRQILLNRYRNARSNRPFNGALVRQATSTEIIAHDRGKPMNLQPTRYFDLMCSNYLTESYLIDQRSNSKILDGIGLIRDSTGYLPRLESSDLANPIGVSTLAFDSTHKLILIQQSEFAQSSRNLWSPSGSGSLEPADVQKTSPRSDGEIPFVDVLRRGMNRELVEESHIHERVITDSRVIAYFRWLNKGAKPEYIGVTLLDRPVTLLRRRLSEFRWVRGIEVGVTVDFDRLERNPASAQLCLGDDQSEREMFAIRMSFPLYVALHALGEQLRGADGPAFRRWLFSR